MIAILPVGSLPTLPLIEFLTGPSCDQLDRFGYDASIPIIPDKKVNVITSHGIIEHPKAVTLLGLKKPLEPPTAVSGKLEKELLLMSSMSNLPC
jgi:hypothetical protein